VIVRAAPPEHLQWLTSRAKLTLSPSLRAIEAVEGDRILGMVGYDDWMDNACSIHLAVDAPIAIRRLVGPAFRVPFVELGLGTLVAKVLSTNTRSLQLIKHFGFREIARGRDWIRPGIDLVISELRREDCKWAE